MLRRSARIANHSVGCACETCSHRKGYPACSCTACKHAHGFPACECADCIHAEGFPTCNCEECAHDDPACQCADCIHEKGPCECEKCGRGKEHPAECSCELCRHDKGYPVCHCFDCALKYGIPSKIALIMKIMMNGKLCFCNAEWLIELPDVLPVGLKILCVRNATQLKKLPPLPEGLLELECRDTKIRKLPPLPSSLTWLSCENCHVKELPQSLVYLEMDYNQNIIKERITIPPLPPKLETLIVRRGLVTMLPPLPMSLRYLNVQGNRIKRLPHPMPPLHTLDTRRNPLEGLPPLREGLINFQMDFDTLNIALKDKSVIPDSLLKEWINTMAGYIYRIRPEKLKEELEHRKELEKVRSLSRCAAIKECLMMNRWHPNRIGPLIEAGWDVEDI